MLSENVKSAIENEVISIFPKNNDIKNMINLYEMVININIDDDDLSGIKSRIPHALEQFFHAQSNDLLDNEILVKSFINIEPFLKKIYFYTNKERFLKRRNDREDTFGLWTIIVDLIKLPDEVKRGNDPESFWRWKHDNEKFYVEHLLRTFKVRNSDSHTCKSWDRATLFQNIQSVLVTSLFFSNKYERLIKRIHGEQFLSNELNVMPYLSKIILKYEKKIADGFKFVPIKWERKTKENNCDSNICTMDTLRHNIKGNKHVFLLGEAGTGKSTSIEYLMYLDAKACMASLSNPIPVLIKMNEITENFLDFEDEIGKQLSISYDDAKILINEKALSLYIDGINELSVSILQKKRILRKLEDFFGVCKEIFVLITDRENSIKTSIPIFSLKYMNTDDIKLFLDEQLGDSIHIFDNLMTRINVIMQSNVIFTPLMLNMFVTIGKAGIDLPESIDDLVGEYLRALIKREYIEKKEPLAKSGKMENMLAYLALKIIDSGDEGFLDTDVMIVFRKCSEYLGFEADASQCISLSIQLGILKWKNDRIVFLDSSYKDFYLSIALNKDMEMWQI